MKPSRWRVTLWLAAVVWTAVGTGAAMAVEDNPYSSIVDRNPFGLKPPPPPVPVEEQTPPPPPAKVTLTGIITMFGPPRALFEIVEGDGKNANATPQKPILREGERAGSVEVLAIDVAKNLVKIRNGPQEAEITFETPKQAAAPATPGGRPVIAPPALAPGQMPQPPIPGAPAPATPTVISAGNTTPQLGGVTVLGGGSETGAPKPGATPGTQAATSQQQYNTGTTVLGGPADNAAAGVPSPVGADTGRRLPSRRVRTEPLPALPLPTPYPTPTQQPAPDGNQ